MQPAYSNSMNAHPQEFALNPLVVAYYILWKRRERETTNLDVIKLTFLSHGWYLGAYGVPLITEAIVAWPYGPVIHSIYDHFKSFDENPIRVHVQDNSALMNARQRAMIDATLESYKDFDSWALSGITHQKGSPWFRTIEDLGIGYTVPDNLIKEYYGKMYEDYHARQK